MVKRGLKEVSQFFVLEIYKVNLTLHLDFVKQTRVTRQIYMLYIIHPQINFDAQLNLVCTDQARMDNKNRQYD